MIFLENRMPLSGSCLPCRVPWPLCRPAWRTAHAIRFCFASGSWNVSASDRIVSALLKCALGWRAAVNAFQEGHRFGVALIEPAARRGGFQRKTHLDVGGGEF